MKTIAVLAAMGMEADCFIRRMEDAKPETIAGRDYLRGRVGEAGVVLHRCGWGMDRSAAGARAVIEACQPEALILYGVSGAIVPELALSDTVVASASFPASGKYAGEGAKAVPTDEKLADFAMGVLEGARKAPVATTQGVIINKKRNDRIVERSGAVCSDMESYTVALTARELGVPLLVIRSMSDVVKRSSLLLFFKHGRAAAEKAAADTEKVIRALAEM